MLYLSFVELPPEIVARLAQAETKQLQAWSLRLLNAHALDDVFR